MLTLASVYLIFHYTNMLGRPMERISQEMEQLQQAGASIARIRELRQARSRLVEAPAGTGGHRPIRGAHGNVAASCGEVATRGEVAKDDVPAAGADSRRLGGDAGAD